MNWDTPPPTIYNQYRRRKGKRGISWGQLGLGLVKNDDNGPRGCYKNDDVWEAVRGTFCGGHGVGFFGILTTTTETTTTGGSDRLPPLLSGDSKLRTLLKKNDIVEMCEVLRQSMGF